MKSLGITLALIIIIIMIRSCNSNEFKIKKSIYTKSCPEGKFVVKKLTSGMKIPRYRFLIEQSRNLKKLLNSKAKTKWFKLTDAEFEVDFPRISKQSSYIMIYKALQQYSASVHFLIQKTNRKLRKDLISIKNELRKMMCSVEGLLNGMHASERKYKFISEKDMEIWLKNNLGAPLSPLAITKELVQNLMEFNQIVFNVANQRLNNLTRNKRQTKLKELTNH